MGKLTKRLTVYFEPDVQQALKLKSIETSHSISSLVNEALKEALREDLEDLAAYEKREKDSLISYDQMTMKLNKKTL
jgi:hypothetical protein